LAVAIASMTHSDFHSAPNDAARVAGSTGYSNIPMRKLAPDAVIESYAEVRAGLPFLEKARRMKRFRAIILDVDGT
jgi:hypothetical protein